MGNVSLLKENYIYLIVKYQVIIFLANKLTTRVLARQIIQYILNKTVKPKLIPKLDFSNGIDKQNSCIVVIPTIVKNKEKVKEMMENLEKYYLKSLTFLL